MDEEIISTKKVAIVEQSLQEEKTLDGKDELGLTFLSLSLKHSIIPHF